MLELNRIYNMDCLEGMKSLDDNSVDSIVTDPPYELGFMGKKWDSTGIAYNVEVWQECLRVLKPGGHLLAFGGTRTYHRMACAVEDVGFEIRDQIMWIYGSGFPKSMNIGKTFDKKEYKLNATTETLFNNPNGKRDLTKRSDYGYKFQPLSDNAKKWNGWGTALKPAHEPIVVARKPLSEKTIVDNVLKWGTGGINIDGCRIPTEDSLNGGAHAKNGTPRDDGWGMQRGGAGEYIQPTGRFPANVILDEEAGRLLDEQSGISKSKKSMRGVGYTDSDIYGTGDKNFNTERGFNDTGGASRFFYCAKASKKERNMGLDETLASGNVPHNRGNVPKKNHHPTVKPIKLMEYLITLITPPAGIVLDPFFGSGTTGIAAVNLGFNYIGFEISKEYCIIAEKRISQIKP
jgi:site-specific DNA-methyltransferase (adenine-specific)